ncbi:MAG TPA: N-acetylmuramoyl-L-alanine amidase [Acetobacteraceae bacterium]|nr:N-acetylmuramoyl-L-alanine amidase [Acetobacteraceae bacterium]
MAFDPAFTRRLLLGHGFGAALILPAAARSEVARHSVHARGRQPRQGLRPLIMLDPGHGGKDPGAIGVSGTYEKHVALATAGDLAQRLEASGRYRVALTRQSDDFIALDDRVAIAQARGADMFMSIHADALTNHAVRGASVYTLAAHASDAQSAALAARENAADRFDGGRESQFSPQVAQILASLVAHETRVGSARLQERTVGSLGQDFLLLENPARHAAFEVLKSPDIPSVLVEMGFMSNPEDEAALRQEAHRARVAAALHEAIDAYFASTGHLTHIAG